MVWVGSSVGGVEYKTPVYIMPDMVELCNMTDQSGMSTALGQPRPLNSICVRSLKKLSMDNVEMDLWLTGVCDREKICILVDMPCIILS